MADSVMEISDFSQSGGSHYLESITFCFKGVIFNFYYLIDHLQLLSFGLLSLEQQIS